MQAQGQPGPRRMGVACRHVDGDDDRPGQVRRGQRDVLSNWEGAQVAVVDGDNDDFQRSGSGFSLYASGLERTKSSLWASLLFGRLAWRLAPTCCRQRIPRYRAVFTGRERTGVSRYPSMLRTALALNDPCNNSLHPIFLNSDRGDTRMKMHAILAVAARVRVWLPTFFAH